MKSCLGYNIAGSAVDAEFHVLATDGTVSVGDDGEAVFHPALDLAQTESAAVQAKMGQRDPWWLRHDGHLDVAMTGSIEPVRADMDAPGGKHGVLPLRARPVALRLICLRLPTGFGQPGIRADDEWTRRPEVAADSQLGPRGDRRGFEVEVIELVELAAASSIASWSVRWRAAGIADPGRVASQSNRSGPARSRF